MVRLSFWAVLACPLMFAFACGDDGAPDDGHGGDTGDGGAPTEGGAPTQGGSGGSPEGGQAGGPTQGGRGGEGGGVIPPGGAGAGGTPDGAGAGGMPSGAGAGGTPSSGGVGGESGGAGGGGSDGGPLTLTVTTDANVREISPLIYGITPRPNVACDDPTARFTLCRLGGNRWSTYNWENNAANAGADSGGCSLNTDALGTSDTAGLTVTNMIDTAEANSATTVLTVPMIDYVAADKIGGGSAYPVCSGSVKNSLDYETTRLRTNQARKGAPFVYPPDTSDQTVSQDEFIAHVLGSKPTAKVMFTLDNQPELWNQTHINLHKSPISYKTVTDRSIDFATMIREASNDAAILGPASYGWQGMIDLQERREDYDAEFLDYYLVSMAEASRTAGARLLDYLDVHWASDVDVDGVVISDVIDDGSPEIVAARAQATRSLFDPNYIEPSWIGDSYGEPIRLIPRLQEKITRYYPGTKLAITYWSYGGEGAISGALAVADALGIYGREGVDLAAFAPISADNSFALGAFAMFRNHDGAGATFGDHSVRAVSSDPHDVTVYASTDSSADDRLVIIAINKNLQPLTATLEVQDARTFTDADVYVLTSDSALPAAADPLASSGANQFEYELPGSSISVIVPRN